MGQLTHLGLEQLRRIGELLRERYVDELRVLPPVFDARTVFVRSTDTNRTIESAQSLLWGLYPPSTRPHGRVPSLRATLICAPLRQLNCVCRVYVCACDESKCVYDDVSLTIVIGLNTSSRVADQPGGEGPPEEQAERDQQLQVVYWGPQGIAALPRPQASSPRQRAHGNG